jgi:DNA-binding SARP family transcriptional activator
MLMRTHANEAHQVEANQDLRGGTGGTGGAAGTGWTGAAPSLGLNVLGRFELIADGITIAVNPMAAKVLAFLVVRRRPTPRHIIASTLWPDRVDSRARANLRAAIWRMPAGCRPIVVDEGGILRVGANAVVDLDTFVNAGRRIIALGGGSLDEFPGLVDDALTMELLPGWDDDWVVAERERLRQLCLHCLEAISERLLHEGRAAEAVTAADAAVRLEPLRETAARALVEAHVAVGNVAEAHRVVVRYSLALDRELGLAPSARLTGLIPAPSPRNDGAVTAGPPSSTHANVSHPEGGLTRRRSDQRVAGARQR